MADAMEQARLAVRLEDARNTVRRLYGAQYDAVMEPWRQFVRDAAEAMSCSPLAVPARVREEFPAPTTQIILVAAAVDVVEEGTVPRG